MAGTVTIRAAAPHEMPEVLAFIRELAVYEHLEHEVVASTADLSAALFGAQRYAEVVFACLDAVPVGFALFFHNFSTFLALPGIYLEDLFVVPEHRGNGVGRALLKELARIAVERGCGRLEWSVLDWNRDAIGFYERLGAKPNSEWTVYRLAGEALAELGRE